MIVLEIMDQTSSHNPWDQTYYAAAFTTDWKISLDDLYSLDSGLALVPWLQLEFKIEVEVHGVSIFQRIDITAQWNDASINVGMKKAVVGELSSNPQCARLSWLESAIHR